MKIYSIAIGVVSALILSGCAPKEIVLQHKFDAELTRSLFSKEGNNVINGNGFIRQNGGGVVTCSGSTVLLIPKTPYSSDRVRTMFGNTERGYRMYFLGVAPEFNFSEDPREYERMMKNETCDSQGNFTFNKIGDGAYFLITEVLWTVGQYSSQGGALLKSVNVSSGETKKIILTP